MNLTIHPRHVEISDALRTAIEQAARDALEAMGVPPSTPVTLSLRGPAGAGSQRYRAKARIETEEEPLHAKGSGPSASEAIAALRGALMRQAQQWQVRHAGRAAPPDAARLRGDPVSERALREARRLSNTSENPNREADHRPPGYR
ncbi:MAG: hypothetical protein HKN04_01110 [Rhodothermaceae bacterium]|nr:hypothetical protein [Rhodothermaceae bacterium]